MEPRWGEPGTWEEFSSTEEDVMELKEIAFLLAKMDKVQATLSFQQELKKELLEQEKVSPATKNRKVVSLDAFKNPRTGRWARPLFATAVALILVISLTFFYGDARPGQQDPPLTAQGDFKPNSTGMGKITTGESPLVQENNGEENDGETVESGSALGEPAPGPEQETPNRHVQEDPNQAGSSSPARAETGPVSEQKEEPPPFLNQGSTVEEEMVREEPQFEIWEKQLQVQVADIKLPDYYYNAPSGEKDLALAEVKYAWRPGGKFSIAVNGEEKTGLEPKISKKLSEKGFPVEGAYLKVNSIQETQKGVFAEAFFKPRKSSADDPLLVVYYEEGKDIISFYCEEKGKAAGTVYYRLLPPALAFERTKNAKIYASTELLSFSFQEVNLTYYDFPQGDGRQEKLVKLPAYCFTGMETGLGGKEFKLYLPAVAR